MKIYICRLNSRICNNKELNEHKGKSIVLDNNLFKHISKHKKEYISTKSYNKTLKNIDLIIKNPDYVFYNKNRNGLEFYKHILEKLCVVVQIVNKPF